MLHFFHPLAFDARVGETAFSAWYQIAIGRLISGLGVGALSAAVPTVSFSFTNCLICTI